MTTISDQEQYARNAQDGMSWLTQLDHILTTVAGQLHAARDLALQGVGAEADAGVRAGCAEALAAGILEIRARVLEAANTTHLGRPVFGGVTAGDTAYDDVGSFVGAAGLVARSVADGVWVEVQVPGPAVFGPVGGTVFDDLAALADALRDGDEATIGALIGHLKAAEERIELTSTDVRSRHDDLARAAAAATEAALGLGRELAEVDDGELPAAVMDLQMREAAYAAALAAKEQVTQRSLRDFLR